MTRILGSCRSAIMASRRVRRSDLCRRHPRPPRSQRPPHRSRWRQPETPALQIDPKGLTTDLQLAKNPASRAPASQATSSRIAGRHHVGISGRLRRNLHRTRLQATSGLRKSYLPSAIGSLACFLIDPRSGLCRFKCANLISMRFRSWRDRSKAAVPASDRATSRACS
jgi:hypothetical protein